jgi:tetratricopeptide (TPR) repeat protein
MDDDFDPFRILGLPVGADEAAIRRRYRALVRKHHPDVSADAEKAHERFVRIQEAYRALMDPDGRAQWERRAGAVGAEAPRVVVARPGTRAEQLLAEARALLRQRQLRRAHQAVAESIELNPLSAEAHQLMGDIYLTGGKNQLAAEMYQEAERLGARPAAHRVNPSDPVPPFRPEAPAKPAVRVPVLAIGLAGVAICLAEMALTDFETRRLAFAAWGLAAAFLLAAAGAASGALEPIDELVGLASVGEPGRGAAPGALYLIVLSLVSPYLGLVYYVVSSAITETHTKGAIKAFAATFGLSLFAWLAARGSTPGYLPVVAPSLAFAGVLAGWIAGSFASPGEWWRR